MKSIDFKSLLIGILGTALVMLLMGLAHTKDETYLIKRFSESREYSGWTATDKKGKKVCKHLLVYNRSSN